MREYGDFNKKLSTYIPWFLMLKEGLILNKNGTLQKTLEIRGYDLENCTDEEMKVHTTKLNNVLKRLEGGYVLHIDSIRMKCQKYQIGNFPDLLGQMIDKEREAFFNKGDHYETKTFLTITYTVPTDQVKKVEKMMIDSDFQAYEKNYVEIFLKEFKHIKGLLKSVFLAVEELTEEETLTFLHDCVSVKKQKVILPKTPIFLSNYLCDSLFVGGLKPKLDDEYVRCISILGFPHVTYPCFFDKLNKLDIEYRWHTRFKALDKLEALEILNSKWKKWFSGRFSLWQMIQKEITQREPTNQNEDALLKAGEVKDQEILTQGDYVSQGFYINLIVLRDKNVNEIERKVEVVTKVIQNLGFITIDESYNAVHAFLGSIPGDIYHNLRDVSILNSLTLSHLMPFSEPWAGESWNKYLNEPPLIYTQTTGSTPFRINLHGDSGVAHTLILGRTGAGKSVLLGDIAFNWRKYKNSKTFIFDKDRSSLVLTKAVGGKFYDIGEDKLSFQPLRNIDELQELEWANQFILDILEQENIVLDANIKKVVWETLTLLAKDPIDVRTMTAFVSYCNLQQIKDALNNYTKGGALGRYFDSNNDDLDISDWVVFEMAKVIDNRQAIGPLLSYLFRKIYKTLDGIHPVIVLLDECWLFLANEAFREKIKDWLKTFRKKKAGVIFATQELSDITKSVLKDTILNACETKIFLANKKANNQDADLYREFGLNTKELNIITDATERKDYYFKSNKGSRLFDLSLGQIEIAFIASTDLESQSEALKLSERVKSADEFCKEWLKYKDVKGNIEEVLK